MAALARYGDAMWRMTRKFAAGLALCHLATLSLALPSRAGDGLTVTILYAEQKFERPPRLSGLRPFPDDLGLAGAKLAIEDNQTTGKFLNQNYQLKTLVAEIGQSLPEMIAPALKSGADFIVLNAPADVILKVADLPEAQGKILFNTSARDESLREENCRKNVLHTIPSRAMLTDALAQFFLKKNWKQWLIVSGSRSGDLAYADALRASATKFGIEIAGDVKWDSEQDMRESASVEVPLMTQLDAYDAVLVADESDDFAPVIAFNSWLPRPLAGTHGLVATGWSSVVEAWGAVQLQNRFTRLNNRDFREADFAAWLAVRIVGEAVSRLGEAGADKVRPFILSEDLQMSAFNGRGLTFRPWNGQLRQPIHLVTSDTQVATAPFEEFLHETNDMDTLGKDRPETLCKAFE
jgi:ABC transporter substrate binding protein (PQQ-dependent alcohol dehydrogenase system)